MAENATEKRVYAHLEEACGGQDRWASWQTLRQRTATMQSRPTKMIRYRHLKRGDATL